jgi:hypothetical protein
VRYVINVYVIQKKNPKIGQVTALFLNRQTNTIVPTIVQADGLVYDYSFGERELTEKEVAEIRKNNKNASSIQREIPVS